MDAVKQAMKIDYTVFIPTIIFTLIVVLLAVQFISKLLEWFFVEKLGIETKWGRKKRQEHELLIKTAESLNTLQEIHKEDMKRSDQYDEEIKDELTKFTDELRQTLKMQNEKMNEFSENRVKDREKSREIQKELINAQTKISDAVEVVSNKLDKMKKDTDNRFQENEKWKYENEEKQNAKERNKIKAEISNRYSIYHERKWITDIEFEALQGLISSYESFGGTNSFIHSKVEPEMYSWKKVSDD